MSDLADNPLLSLDFEIPFHRIRAEHVEPGIDILIGRVQEALRRIGDDEAPPTYDNSLGALEEATEPLELAMGVVGHLEGVRTTESLRAAYNEVRPRAQELFSAIPLDPALYQRLVALSKTDEAAALSPTKKRFLDKTLRQFERNGANLEGDDKQKLRELDVLLAKLTTKFAQNVLDETNAFELVVTDEAQLAGLPENAKKAARASAHDKGKSGWRFTLQAPSLIAAMTYLEDASIRETMWRAYNSRASHGEHNNRPLIEQIVELRREKAQLLGYRDFADFVLAERMAKRGDDAKAFVADLAERTAPFFERETEELTAFRRELEGPDAPPLDPWDVGFYAEKMRKARFDFDDEEVRPYFSAERVVGGLFSVVERLYGVKVEEKADCPRWHEDVRCFRLVEKDGTDLGSFYVDLFPREDKRGGAWMNAFITGGPIDGGFAPHDFSPHLGLFCANVTPPVGDEPALLSHAEVETIFHEFGHLLHHLLSRVEVKSLAGTHVAWDFVELPSQIMENWTWEREALDLFARHFETDETIPDDLFEKMHAARTFRSASGMMRQLSFATTDLALHIDYDPATDGDPVRYARAKMEPFTTTALPEDYAMVCGFTHLFASPVAYAAGYYSYKWAEVLDADAFTRFKAEGVFDEKVGRAFRDKILARGDAADPDELFRDFMGRDPKVDALLERSGLVAR